ncbi:glycosyltransferase family 4 protein [Nocardiopsis aegyptia]|uniref:glycosyltransferase family 4 protein n=1 Tax=Nocardiopsis aegyptia TaxID=220378 RepID=UPI003672AB28
MKVDTVVQFFPRGGSAQVIRYLTDQLTSRGHTSRILSGSLGDSDQLSNAHTFYRGLDVAAMDYTCAAEAYTRGQRSMDGPAPFHPSYEDRGPTAPDRIFTAVAPQTIKHITAAWKRHLTRHHTPDADLVHLHHLSHLQEAARGAYGTTPVVTTFHGTDLKLLDRAQQVTRLAEHLGVPLTFLRDYLNPTLNEQLRAERLQDLESRCTLTQDEKNLLRATDWRHWPHADTWSRQMRDHVQHAGRLVAVSESDRQEISRLLNMPGENVTVVPNGVETTNFTPCDLSNEQRMGYLHQWLVQDPQGWAPDQQPGSIRYSDEDLNRMYDVEGRLRPLLLWVGRFQEVKRLHLLLEAFADVVRTSDTPPALLIWGGYPGEAEGEHPLTAARRLGISEDVYFIGWRGHDELPQGMNCADLMVAPAVNESFGMVYIEAQACGTPPVATNTGGPATLITSNGPQANGWTVKPDDVADLSATLTKALAQPAERRRRARNGVEHVRANFSWSAVTDQYEQLYDETL